MAPEVPTPVRIKLMLKYLIKLESNFPLVLYKNTYVLVRLLTNALRNVTSYEPVLAARFAHHSLQDL